MLLAVEGGGFFSSSASGYSKGLTLLLLGQRNEEKPMRVTPCNQYQLVEDQEIDPDIQLASEKKLVRGCTSFLCCRTTTGLDNASSLKLGPNQHREVLPETTVSDEPKNQTCLSSTVENDNRRTVTSLKSSLKKPEISVHVSADCSGASAAATAPAPDAGTDDHETSCEENNNFSSQTEMRKVQWTDTSGGELFEIREFEMSEHDSDDEFENENGKTCSCRIM